MKIRTFLFALLSIPSIAYATAPPSHASGKPCGLNCPARSNDAQPLSEQETYVASLVNAMVMVISGDLSLDAAEREYFGNGEFFWPKNPDRPVRLLRTYASTNFRMDGITLHLKRPTQRSPWQSAAISVRPKSTLPDIYRMRILPELLRNFSFVSETGEESPHASPGRVRVMRYIHNTRKVELTVVAPADVQTDVHNRPLGFHALSVKEIRSSSFPP